jgi:hypothetical protein
LLHNGGWQQHCTSILLEELFARYNRNSIADRIKKMLLLNDELLITDDECLEKLWKKTEAVLGVITEDRRMVYAAIKTNAPVVVLQLAVRLYPDQLSGHIDHAANNNSMTPLMCALISRNTPIAVRFQYLHILLQANPRLAEIPNRVGQLPLHVACSQPDFLDWGKGLSTLFRSHPTAVSKRDPESALFPFQIAAVASEANSTSLDSTYELLRADPSVLLLFS